MTKPNKNKISCKTCINLTESFFFGETAPVTTNLIITHLLTCPKCLEYYKEFAKDGGLKWDIMDDVAFNVLAFDDNEDLQKRVEQSIKEFEQSAQAKALLDFIPDKWQQIVKEYDVCKLLGMQAFRDLISEYDNTIDMTDTDYVPYYQYVAMKNAKKIDHLETCLRKEIKV